MAPENPFAAVLTLQYPSSMAENKSDPQLYADELEQIEAARKWIKGHFNVKPDECYKTIDGKLFVVASIIGNHWVSEHETWKLQALGIAFGDALAQKLMLNWVTVEDEYGRDPALNWPGTEIYSFPLTTVSKRIERGEVVDVQELFDQTCSALIDMAFSGRSVRLNGGNR